MKNIVCCTKQSTDTMHRCSYSNGPVHFGPGAVILIFHLISSLHVVSVHSKPLNISHISLHAHKMFQHASQASLPLLSGIKGLSTREAGRGHAAPHMPVETAKCWWLLKIESNAWGQLCSLRWPSSCRSSRVLW